ncbi:hypothetical protein V6Z12_D08G243500 [Gossypium hirsutum]
MDSASGGSDNSIKEAIPATASALLSAASQQGGGGGSESSPSPAPPSSGAHVIEFLKYLDQFGKTKVHITDCPYFGHVNPPAPCACPLKQAWGSLDALIGRLRAAYEENGGRPESNPFGARAVRIYLREVREGQAKARGIPYEKKKRKRPTVTTTAVGVNVSRTSTQPVDGGGGRGGIGGGDDSVGAKTGANVGSATAVAAATTNSAGGM